MPRGILISCQTCGNAFERHERDVTTIICSECQAGLDAMTAGSRDSDSAVPIIAKYDAQVGQWSAWFEDAPQVGFGGDMPVVAIRRLLEFTDAANGTYLLICDREIGDGGGVLHRQMIWDRPELLFPCGDCRGRGEYVGLIERETCRTCGGRKVQRA